MVKYQIFVSSTYEDLKDERSQVIKAILEMGHIPVGMEMFSAADEEQWKIIARQIDETDYYVLVMGNRYGSMVSGVGYTEKEYDYAVSKGVPVLGFVIDSSVDSLAKNVDKEEQKISALIKFKAKVKQRPVGFWKTADDLHGKVSIALMKAFNTNPRTGWSRANSIAGPEVTQELSRLSSENAQLRSQLDRVSRQDVTDRNAYLKARIDTLRANEIILPLREHGKKDWDVSAEVTLLKVFHQLAAEMMVEISIEDASDFLGMMNKPEETMQLSDAAPVPHNHVMDIFANLASLGLVEPSKKKHPVSDKGVYWSLAQDGIDLLKLERVTVLESVVANKLLKAEAIKEE